MTIKFLVLAMLFIAVTWAIAKPLTLLAPAGGERFPVEGYLYVQWETADSGIVQVQPKISFDNGYSYFIMAEDPIDRRISPDWENFEYRIPAYYLKTIRPGEDTVIYTVSDSCRIVIEDYLGTATDATSSVFSIYDDSKIDYFPLAETRPFAIWPNPAASLSELNFRFADNPFGALACYDVSGRLAALWSGNPGEHPRYMKQNVPAGVYLIKTPGGEKTYCVKLTIK